jgi:NADPH:quinone reductase-like Zn-dependent oxidoreductase
MQRSLIRRGVSVISKRYGLPQEVLSFEAKASGDVLAPRAGEVQVRMQASLVGVEDLRTILGVSLSESSDSTTIVGTSGVGIVDAVGTSVSNVKRGDAVLVLGSNNGCWSSSIVSPADAIIRLPSHLSPTQSATLPLLLAANIILQLPIKSLEEDDSVLLARGMDVMLAQAIKLVGKYRNINVISDVASARGARLAISSQTGKATTDVVRRLGPGGLLVFTPGLPNLSNETNTVSLPIAKAIFTDVAVRGFHLHSWVASNPSEAVRALEQIWPAIENKELLLPVNVWPLSEYGDAIASVQENSDAAAVLLLFE